MPSSSIISGVVIDNDLTISYVEICQKHHLPESWLLDLLEHGLLGEVSGPFQQMTFDMQMLQRLQSAYRLQHDLGLNSAGAVLALELMDELTQLRDELQVLQRHLHEP